jgi:hypothetical protein
MIGHKRNERRLSRHPTGIRRRLIPVVESADVLDGRDPAMGRRLPIRGCGQSGGKPSSSCPQTPCSVGTGPVFGLTAPSSPGAPGELLSVNAELLAAVRKMAAANPLRARPESMARSSSWEAKCAERTVSRLIPRQRTPPSRACARSSQTMSGKRAASYLTGRDAPDRRSTRLVNGSR